MAIEPQRREERPLSELLGSVLGQISTLFRQEVRLARAELGEKLGRTTSAITPLAAGAGLLLGAVVILLLAVAAGLVALEVDTGWALLIVGVGAALIGWMLLRSGISRLSAAELVPERTADQLSRDAQMAKEQVR